jgi:Fe-S-cluster-containing dehydrogenase component
MSDDITLTIDYQEVTVPRGSTILEAAEQLGIEIPTICFHPALTANAVCRICVVEAEGGRVLLPGCVAECADGMVISTRNERVKRSRRTILEMLDSAVDLSEAPAINEMAADYRADTTRFEGDKKRDFETLDDNPFYVRDYNQCVMCWRCVQVCADDAQYTYACRTPPAFSAGSAWAYARRARSRPSASGRWSRACRWRKFGRQHGAKRKRASSRRSGGRGFWVCGICYNQGGGAVSFGRAYEGWGCAFMGRAG